MLYWASVNEGVTLVLATIAWPATQRHRLDGAGLAFDLFNWSGVLEPTNVFSRIELPDGRWDVGQIYVAGEVVLTALPGDANGDLEFNQLDIAEVLAAGKYLGGQRAVWGEGDWNNDGLFN